ncbi:hypothetical protein DPMN_094423 [Dreissena polymorpha]|uniref:Uncharacterized protein n=1 Tax=Dreissena polymorpha TaxID=45954 RepID=A0A9D4L7M1_DREPO|nr:hypothetical protein DPMN_094423 [Dreissena polymorpha]
MKGGCRGHYQEGSPDPILLSQVGQTRQALDRLAQSHLVCEDPVDALVIQTGQPIHALQVIQLVIG